MPEKTAGTLITPRAADLGGRGAQGADLIRLLDRVSFLMDRLVPIPGTRLRAGLNTLLLLLPVAGDTLASVVSIAILAAGLTSQRVPRVVAARMVLNALLDAGLGWIPVVGDLFDLFFKADTRNVRLLMEYAGRGDEAQPSTWVHWLFILGVGGMFLLLLGLLIAGFVLLAMKASHTLSL
jgi:hypothetical protein